MRITLLLAAVLLTAVSAQTDDKIWCPATENYLNHHGSKLHDVFGLESLEACEAACDEDDSGCNFVWFKPIVGPRKSVCKLVASVPRFKPRIFLSRGMTYTGRLCVQDDPQILPCISDWHCYTTDYCNLERMNCEPKCNGDTICLPCESCYDLEDGSQECRADGSKCPLTEEPTTPEPTDATEEPTEATDEPTDATEEPTTADPTEGTPEPTTLEPTAAPTAPQWCPVTNKYMNHNGKNIGTGVGLESMDACKESCDNTPDCNFVWFFEPRGRHPSQCRLFSGAVFLKPRKTFDLRPITYAGRLCGVTDFEIFCTRPTHCYATDTCNYNKRVCEPGLESPLTIAEEITVKKLDDKVLTNAEFGLLQLLLAMVGVAAVFYGACRTLMGVLFDGKNYAPVPGETSSISEDL